MQKYTTLELLSDFMASLAAQNMEHEKRIARLEDELRESTRRERFYRNRYHKLEARTELHDHALSNHENWKEIINNEF